MSKFSTNQAGSPVLLPKPTIWAHLFVMEKWAPFCGPDGHEQRTNTEGNTPNLRLKQAADGIALISAVGRDATSVTACSIEGIIDEEIIPSPPPSKPTPSNIKFTVRLSRNGAFPSGELDRLRRLLAETAEQVDSLDWTTMDAEVRFSISRW